MFPMMWMIPRNRRPNPLIKLVKLMAIRTKVKGLKDLEKRLQALGKHTTAKAVARRVLKQAGKPIAETASRLAPDDPSTVGADLKESIVVSTTLNKSQRRSMRKVSKSAVEVHVGTNDPAGIQQEFGNVNHGPQPFMRPAWDSQKRNALKIITENMGEEIDKTARRLAKRAAKG